MCRTILDRHQHIAQPMKTIFVPTFIKEKVDKSTTPTKPRLRGRIEDVGVPDDPIQASLSIQASDEGRKRISLYMLYFCGPQVDLFRKMENPVSLRNLILYILVQTKTQ